MPSHRSLVSLSIVAACLLSGATAAAAQSISLSVEGIKRSQSNRPSSQEHYWISRSDCLVNDTFTFPLTLGGDFSNDTLEVWVGSPSDDCATKEARTSDKVCWQVYGGTPNKTSFPITVPARNIVSQDLEATGAQTYDDDICEVSDNDATTVAHGVRIHFFLINDGAVQASVVWETSYDLVGPRAPEGVDIGVGDTVLLLDWDNEGNVDLVGYKFYCDPAPGAETPTSLDASTLKAADVVVSDVALPDGNDTEAGDATADVETDAAADAATEAATDAATDATTEAATDATTEAAADGGSTVADGCETDVLKEGADPPAAYLCGSGTGGSGKVTGLINGQTYSIAVAGVDRVGNVGKLSNVECDAPTIVDDFFRVYRDAGGQAGGGFCTASGGIGHGAGVSGLLLIALAALGSTLRRRRGL